MKIESKTNAIIAETKSQKPSFSVSKIITAVALTAIALVVYAISSQQLKSLPSFKDSNDDVLKMLPESDLEALKRSYPQRKLVDQRIQLAAAGPLCTRAIQKTTNGELAPTTVWVKNHHNHCECHVKEEQMADLLIACTYISDEEKSTLVSSGVDLEAAPFQIDITNNDLKACFLVVPTRHLRTNS